jgi:hypothetical protein
LLKINLLKIFKMAKIQFGMMMTDARGKLGGQVFSKNRAGAYIRSKVTPSNPQTLDQQANRALLGSTSRGWSGLTQAQRDAWNTAVVNWPMKTIFGATSIPSGKSLYVMLNKNLLAIGGTEITTPPTKADTPVLGLTGVQVDISSQTIVLSKEGATGDFVLQLRATPILTKGTSNAKNRFRVIYAATNEDYVPTDAYTAWVNRFGVFTVGANVQFSVALISPTTGQISVAETVTGVVQA